MPLLLLLRLRSFLRRLDNIGGRAIEIRRGVGLSAGHTSTRAPTAIWHPPGTRCRGCVRTRSSGRATPICLGLAAGPRSTDGVLRDVACPLAASLSGLFRLLELLRAAWESARYLRAASGDASPTRSVDHGVGQLGVGHDLEDMAHAGEPARQILVEPPRPSASRIRCARSQDPPRTAARRNSRGGRGAAS